MESSSESTALKGAVAVKEKYRLKQQAEKEKADAQEVDFDAPSQFIKSRNVLCNPLRLSNFEKRKGQDPEAFQFVADGKKKKEDPDLARYEAKRRKELQGEFETLEAAIQTGKIEQKQKQKDNALKKMHVQKLVDTLDMTSKQKNEKEKGDKRKEAAALRKKGKK